MPLCELSKLRCTKLCLYMLIILVFALGILKRIGILIACILTWFLGVFAGKWMFGYKASYEEYYHASST